MSSEEVTDLTLHLLEKITNKFSKEHIIGKGGYGEVYRAVLNGHEIAVKKLYLMNGIDDKDFTNEFRQLMKVQHENIIRLIAYCYEIKHKHTPYDGQLVFSQVIDRALCFEYMPGGSLANHIFDESCIHDWATTYKIIKGTCEGLHYLHKGRGEGDYIYHLDLKPDNILLDKDMIPKIADFGLSRLFGESRTYETSSARRGSLGFMAPEYINNGAISPQNDVFSLGVIIFYLLVGKKGYNDYCESRSSRRQEFTERVQEYWKRRTRAVADNTWDEIDLLGVKICTELAMRCVEIPKADRPRTMEIIDALHKLDVRKDKMAKKDTESPTDQRNLDCTDIALNPSQELCFMFKPKMELSCCLPLTNKVDGFVAFNIKASKKYCARPSQGIMPPFSKSYIIVTTPGQDKAPSDMQCRDELIVQSKRVSKDFTSQNITPYFLKKATMVDEMILPIAYVAME
ncbi:putative receptor-like protein kinase At4g00960 [Triticum dicoccoides]|uniref:putative receptor-like protein kinase At4g00960 n=1 Tax=Triticum dicoccoides TaxID=85692 RepID=UPI0018906519|nr:putative receptor-like protein kinase At4g00960 [Triticum dicoccoides]